MSTRTVSYSRVLRRSEKAVQLDLGESRGVWFPLRRIALDEDAYTVTGPKDLMDEKTAEARGTASEADDRQRVKLPKAAKETAKAVCIAMVVSGVGGNNKVKTDVWLPKSMLDEEGQAPVWLVDKKQKEAIREIAVKRNWTEDQLVIQPFSEKGLLAKASTKQEAEPESEPVAVRQMARTAFAGACMP